MGIKLNTFSLSNPIVNPKTGSATIDFLSWINNTVKSIQSAVSSDEQFTADIAYSIQQAGIAITTAKAAQAAAMAITHEAALVNSYITPSSALTTALSADKTSASIIVANHQRIYGDGTSVAVTGATITGLALSTTYYVTYLDPTRAGGTVNYTTTTDPSQAAQGQNLHLVGTVTTPAADGTGGQSSGTTGAGVPPRYVKYGQPTTEQQ